MFKLKITAAADLDRGEFTGTDQAPHTGFADGQFRRDVFNRQKPRPRPAPCRGCLVGRAWFLCRIPGPGHALFS